MYPHHQIPTETLTKLDLLSSRMQYFLISFIHIKDINVLEIYRANLLYIVRSMLFP